MVVPEINSRHARPEPGIIANPNCSTIQMVLVLEAIRRLSPLVSVRVATYQSASGAGQKGIDELVVGTRAVLDGEPVPPAIVHAKPLPFNCVPQIGTFDADGYTTEELKMVYETRKILGLPELPLSATCVRVPVLRAHCEVVHVVTEHTVDIPAVSAALDAFEGLVVVDDPASDSYPTATDAEGMFDTMVGRLRRDFAHPNGLVFWVVSDNLLKGAALNAVQIAEIVWDKKRAAS